MASVSRWAKRAVVASKRKEMVDRESQRYRIQRQNEERKLLNTKKKLVARRKAQRKQIVNQVLASPGGQYAMAVGKLNAAKPDPHRMKKANRYPNPALDVQANPEQRLAKFRSNQLDKAVDSGVRPESRDVWAKIYEYEAVKIAEEDVQVKSQIKSQQQRMRAALDNQIKQQKQLHLRQLEEEKVYTKQQNDLAERGLREEAEEKRAKFEKNKKLRLLRMEQLAQRADAARKAERRRVASERAAVERAQQFVAAQMEKDREAKRQAKLRMEAMMADNERRDALKLEAHRADAQHTLELNKQYAAMLAKQDADREQRLRATYAHQQRRVDAALYRRQDDAEVSRQREERAAKERAAVQAAKDEKERQRRAARKRRTEEQMAALREQVARNQRERRAEVEADAALADMLARDDNAAVEEEVAKEAAVRQRNVQHKAYLRRQRSADRRRRAAEQRLGMSALEKKLNRRLIKATETVDSSRLAVMQRKVKTHNAHTPLW